MLLLPALGAARPSAGDPGLAGNVSLRVELRRRARRGHDLEGELYQTQQRIADAVAATLASEDARWTFEACAPIFEASPALHVSELVHTGLTNMMLQVTDVVAQGCAKGASVVFVGMPETLGSHAATRDVSEFLQISVLNAKLRADHQCSTTRLVPRQCLAFVSVDGVTDGAGGGVTGRFGPSRMTASSKAHPGSGGDLQFLPMRPGAMFKHAGRTDLSDTIMHYVDLRDRVGWTSRNAVTGNAVMLPDKGYDAVHLNLDADWIIFRKGTYPFIWQKYFRGSKRKREDMERVCCDHDSGRPEMLAWIREVLADFIRLSRKHFAAERPVLVATSIGKSAEPQTTGWILDEFLAGNPQLTFVLGHTNTSAVQLNAAAEARMLQRSSTFLYAAGSTFSHWIKGKVDARGGHTVAVEY